MGELGMGEVQRVEGMSAQAIFSSQFFHSAFSHCLSFSTHPVSLNFPLSLSDRVHKIKHPQPACPSTTT